MKYRIAFFIDKNRKLGNYRTATWHNATEEYAKQASQKFFAEHYPDAEILYITEEDDD